MLIEAQMGSGETPSLPPSTSRPIYIEAHYNAHNGPHLHGLP
jgi:hypothetical protein